jgi:ribosomal protein L36
MGLLHTLSNLTYKMAAHTANHYRLTPATHAAAARLINPITPYHTTPTTPNLTLARLMRVRASLKKRCDACYFARRGKILYMYCKAHPRHKGRQGPKRRQD